jgi:peptidoglycan/xylan/chitin deacetylase (PgdA/CDA1 family)
MRLLDELGIKVSTHLNSDVCTTYPQLADAIKRRGWEIAAHSTNQAEPLSIFFGDVDAEREHIRKTLSVIERTFGQRPVGWVSPGAGTTPESIRLLREEGFEWFGDWSNDDQPFDVTTPAGSITCIPYNFDINDIIHFQREQLTGDDFVDKIRDQYEVLDDEGRESGRVLTIGVHPYLLGRPYRYAALKRALEWLKAQDGAWFCHRSDIMAAWRSR